MLVYMNWRKGSSCVHSKTACQCTNKFPYLSLGLSLREDATDTLADDWLLSRCASLKSRRYSSPEPKGKGVTLSGVWLLVDWAPSSTHDSVISWQPNLVFQNIKKIKPSTVEPGYNDIGLSETSSITSDNCGTNQFLTINRNIILLGYNDTSAISSDNRCATQFLTINRNVILLGYNNTPYITSDNCGTNQFLTINRNVILLGYNDTPSKTSDVLRYQSVPHY